MNLRPAHRLATLGAASIAIATTALAVAAPANAQPPAFGGSSMGIRITDGVKSRDTLSSEGTSQALRAMDLDDDNDTCGLDEFDVLESTRGVVGDIKYYYGDDVVITPNVDHKIWAGVWFTGWNGPAGWTDSPAPSDYPLPGAPEYSLIGRLGNGPWQYIGNRAFTFHQEKEGYWQKVVLRTNDNNPGNGDGAFYATSNCA